MSDSAPITWFTENPAPILIAGIVVLLALGGIFLKSGRGILLFAMAGVAGFMALAVLIDHLVVTDREQVANTIYEMAAAAPRNDLNAVIDHIDPQAGEVRGEARRWIGQVRLDSVSISAMDVTVDHATSPLQATAEFRVFARGEFVGHNLSGPAQYLGRLIVQFRRQDNHWLVIAYERDH